MVKVGVEASLVVMMMLPRENNRKKNGSMTVRSLTRYSSSSSVRRVKMPREDLTRSVVNSYTRHFNSSHFQTPMPMGTGSNSRNHGQTRMPKTINAMIASPQPPNTSTFRICEGDPWKMVFSSLMGSGERVERMAGAGFGPAPSGHETGTTKR